MTRHEVHKILEVPFLDRHKAGLQTFEWEHCSKSFYKIPNDLALNHLIHMSSNMSEEDITILSCECNSSVYYFGIGLDDCDNITLGQLKKLYNHGIWYVYTWCD